MLSEIADFTLGAAAAGLWLGQSALARKVLPKPPALAYCRHRAQCVKETVEYKPGLKADIWHPVGPRRGTFLFIPGGAWVLGQRRPQGYAILSDLIENGWTCVAIDYRVAPFHRWPKPFVDVGTAYTWVRERHPGFVAIGGASAGGHMAMLGALTWDDPPDAVVGLYGAYDWVSRHTPYREGFMRFLERVVVGIPQRQSPAIYNDASPIHQAHRHAPPTLLVHGTADRLCPVEDARRLTEALGHAYLYEVEGAPHGFDLTHAKQTADAVDRIRLFLNNSHLDYMEVVS